MRPRAGADKPEMDTARELPDRDRVRLMMAGVALALAALATWTELAQHGGYASLVLCKAAFVLMIAAAWPLTADGAPLAAAGRGWTRLGRLVLATLAVGVAVFFVAGESWWIPFLELALLGLVAWMGALARAMRPAGSRWWPALVSAGIGFYFVAPGLMNATPALAELAVPSLALIGWGAYPGQTMATAGPVTQARRRPPVVRLTLLALVGVVSVAFTTPSVLDALFPPHGISPAVARLPLTAPSSCRLDRSQGGTVYLLPLAPGGSGLGLTSIAAGLNRRYGWHLVVLPPLGLTRDTADLDRSQLTVQKVWRSITDRCQVGPGTAPIAVIGVTSYDMWSSSYPGWLWLYSQRFPDDADPGAVISTARLAPLENPGRPLRERLRKVLIRDVAVAYLKVPLGSDPMLTTPSSIGELDGLPNDLVRRLPRWP